MTNEALPDVERAKSLGELGQGDQRVLEALVESRMSMTMGRLRERMNELFQSHYNRYVPDHHRESVAIDALWRDALKMMEDVA
ncbi:hypothetical protein [Chitinolyticbacter meiyuanensis]|uniref:hypothetical protein n=1 Tax=Chitinolyticbacter meiyuanensis TaxID=682798 RepID=UPI0011E5B707|nr:hypothetical protein [Chitinolyticbacter meiyuanensis]